MQGTQVVGAMTGERVRPESLQSSKDSPDDELLAGMGRRAGGGLQTQALLNTRQTHFQNAQ